MWAYRYSEFKLCIEWYHFYFQDCLPLIKSKVPTYSSIYGWHLSCHITNSIIHHKVLSTSRRISLKMFLSRVHSSCHTVKDWELARGIWRGMAKQPWFRCQCYKGDNRKHNLPPLNRKHSLPSVFVNPFSNAGYSYREEFALRVGYPYKKEFALTANSFL